MKGSLTLFTLLFTLFLINIGGVSAQCSPEENVVNAFADLLQNNDFPVNTSRSYCISTALPDGLPQDLSGTATMTTAGLDPYPFTVTIEETGSGTITTLDASGESGMFLPGFQYLITITAGPTVGSGSVELAASAILNDPIPVVINVIDPLPVTWTRQLTADPQDKKVDFTWGVSDQVEVAGYELQRNFGSGWTRVNTIPVQAGRGELTYVATDQRQNREAAYRIRQHDFDGSESFSNVVVVAAGTGEGITVFPNPVRDVLRFSATEKLVDVSLVSMTGQLVRNNASVVNGSALMVGDLPRGMYILRTKTETGKAHSRRVLLR